MDTFFLRGICLTSCLLSFHSASFGLALGFVSMTVAFFYILVHYDFVTKCDCEEGTWGELFTSFFLILIWTVGLSVL
jgi:hypothetical protein